MYDILHKTLAEQRIATDVVRLDDKYPKRYNNLYFGSWPDKSWNYKQIDRKKNEQNMPKVEPGKSKGTKYNKNWNQVIQQKNWTKYTKIERSSITKIEIGEGILKFKN